MNDVLLQDCVEYHRLRCGAHLAVMPMPDRPLVAVTIRLLAGYAFERPEHLGVAHVLDEVLSKGTERRDGRALNDAFDEIGATHSSYAGRETFGFNCLCLPEFVDQALALHAEMICTPSFPEQACRTAIELTRQALAALEDDPGELAKKLLHRYAYGEPLGRHVLGEKETLERLDRNAIVDHWGRCFSADRMQIAVAGRVDPARLVEQVEQVFGGFSSASGDGRKAEADGSRRVDAAWPLCFRSGYWHHDKEAGGVVFSRLGRHRRGLPHRASPGRRPGRGHERPALHRGARKAWAGLLG